MSSVIHRLFGIRLPADTAAAARDDSDKRLSFEQIRHRLHAVVADCADQRTQRLVYKIDIARNAKDFWLLRSDLHQCISQAHSQAEAALRINSLLHAFEGWLPQAQLTRI